jgi:hypothetical protein
MIHVSAAFLAQHSQATCARWFNADIHHAWSMALKGGIRKRLQFGDASPSSTADAGLPPQLGSSPRPAAQERRGGLRRRVAEVSQQPQAGEQSQAFTQCMRRDWAKGKLSSAHVLEYTSAAQAQGAQGLEHLARHGASANCHRAIVQSLGYPQGAPEITWIEVPLGEGTKAASNCVPNYNFRDTGNARQATLP